MTPIRLLLAMAQRSGINNTTKESEREGTVAPIIVGVVSLRSSLSTSGGSSQSRLLSPLFRLASPPLVSLLQYSILLRLLVRIPRQTVQSLLSSLGSMYEYSYSRRKNSSLLLATSIVVPAQERCIALECQGTGCISQG